MQAGWAQKRGFADRMTPVHEKPVRTWPAMRQKPTGPQEVPRECRGVAPAFEAVNNSPPRGNISCPEDMPISGVVKKVRPRGVPDTGLSTNAKGGGGGAKEAMIANPHITLPPEIMHRIGGQST